MAGEVGMAGMARMVREIGAVVVVVVVMAVVRGGLLWRECKAVIPVYGHEPS